MRCRRHDRPVHEKALVTGATSGIGRALAQALPDETDLLLTGRDAAALAALAGELAREGRRVETLAADLASPDGIAAVIEAADGFAIDLLINNAGLGRYGRHLDNPAEAEAITVRVNAEALTRLTRGLLPGMLGRARQQKARAGLINIASTAAFGPVPKLAVYAASKAFVVSYTEALQAELAHEPVDILLACPGAVATEFGERAGFQGGRLPGAIAPETAASRILAGLGRRHVVFTDHLSTTGFGPIASLRAIGARGLATGMGVFDRLDGLRRRASSAGRS